MNQRSDKLAMHTFATSWKGTSISCAKNQLINMLSTDQIFLII